jgi:APA family basic amino acid/polyamine antiporter
MSRDGLLPPIFGKVHPKFQTPWLATIITGAFAAIFAGLFPIGILGHLVSIGTLFAFMIVCAGILVLRYKRPELVRPFRTPLVPFVPLGGLAVCGYLMYSLPKDTWYRLAIWMGLGLVIYFTYGRTHSKLANE